MTFALIPAAGRSRRMGRPKLALPLAGRSVLEHVVGALQQAGVITYEHDRVMILDRAGLEAASCECYGTVRQQYERLLGGPAGK